MDLNETWESDEIVSHYPTGTVVHTTDSLWTDTRNYRGNLREGVLPRQCQEQCFSTCQLLCGLDRMESKHGRRCRIWETRCTKYISLQTFFMKSNFDVVGEFCPKGDWDKWLRCQRHWSMPHSVDTKVTILIWLDLGRLQTLIRLALSKNIFQKSSDSRFCNSLPKLCHVI